MRRKVIETAPARGVVAAERAARPREIAHDRLRVVAGFARIRVTIGPFLRAFVLLPSAGRRPLRSGILNLFPARLAARLPHPSMAS